MKIYRQGDVLLVAVSKLPKAVAAHTEETRIVLAHGEVTGHAHAIKDVEKAKLWDAGAERFLQVMETVSLRHEEHATINLDPGIYQVVIQSQYTPKEMKRVSD